MILFILILMWLVGVLNGSFITWMIMNQSSRPRPRARWEWGTELDVVDEELRRKQPHQ